MVTVVLVCTGNKYDEWYVDNVLYMICKHGKLEYDRVHIIRDGEGSVYDKLQMFKECAKDEHYLYFDLDVVIKGPITRLVKDDFTLLHAWWRRPAHTPLNSSIMSWWGDNSHIYDEFYEDEDYNRVRYYRGIDEFIHKNIDHKLYDKVCWSFPFYTEEMFYPVCLFNHGFSNMIHKAPWTQKYILQEDFLQKMNVLI